MTNDRVALEDGTTIAADAVLVTTDAAPPPWFERTGLARDDGGFLAVGPTLQVRNDPDVFAAGDCAGLATPRPKSGVFAVRAGPPLADNLRRRARGEANARLAAAGRASRADLDRGALRGRVARHPQGRGRLVVGREGLDRPALDADVSRHRPDGRRAWRASGRRSRARPRQEMRCGGCAAKVGPGPLSRALARLAPARVRRRGRRPRRAGRRRGDRAAGRQASGADGRFLPRLHR